MIKIISFSKTSDVEEAVNNWISKNNMKITDIKYEIASFDDELWHSVLIAYDPGSDE